MLLLSGYLFGVVFLPKLIEEVFVLDCWLAIFSLEHVYYFTCFLVFLFLRSQLLIPLLFEDLKGGVPIRVHENLVLHCFLLTLPPVGVYFSHFHILRPFRPKHSLFTLKVYGRLLQHVSVLIL